METALAIIAAVTVASGGCGFGPIEDAVLQEWQEGLGYVFPAVEGFPLPEADPSGTITEVRLGGVEVACDSLDVYLLGITGGTPLMMASGRYSGLYNFAKSWASFDVGTGLLEVQFQMPGSASWFGGSFSLDLESGTMIQVGSMSGDPSWDAMAAIDSLLPLGEIALAREALDGMFYPQHYYREEEMYCRFLRAAYDRAKELDGTGDPAGAVGLFDYLPDLWRVPDWDGSGLTADEFSETGLEDFMTLYEYDSIAAWYRSARERVGE
jgi:hypothetical protein